jgi:hypothetical protein
MNRKAGFFSVLAGVLLLLGVGQWIDSKSSVSASYSARSVASVRQGFVQEQSPPDFHEGGSQASVALEIEPVQERVTTPSDSSPKKQRIRSRAPASVR